MTFLITDCTRRRQLTVGCICLLFLVLPVFMLSVSANEDQNFDNCLKYELELYEKLYEEKSQGRDLQKALSSIAPSSLSDKDKELIVYFVRTREPQSVVYAITSRCALDYPESSPFTNEQIRELREVEREGIKEVISRGIEGNDYGVRGARNPEINYESNITSYIVSAIESNILDGGVIVLLCMAIKRLWVRLLSVAILASVLGMSHAKYALSNTYQVGYTEGVVQSLFVMFFLLFIFSGIKHIWKVLRNIK